MQPILFGIHYSSFYIIILGMGVGVAEEVSWYYT
jgi:hypothetical protein